MVTASFLKLLHSWLFIDPSEHHYTTQTSKLKKNLNRSSTMLNNVFNVTANCIKSKWHHESRILGLFIWNFRSTPYQKLDSLHYRAFSPTSCCPPTWHRTAQSDLNTQGSHTHHARTRSSCARTTNGEVHGETVTHNNVKRCLHKMNIDLRCYRSGHVGGQDDVARECSIGLRLLPDSRM